jgi:hypothetical protein
MIISVPARAVNPPSLLTLSLQLLKAFQTLAEACFDYNQVRRGVSSQLRVAGSGAVADFDVVGAPVAHRHIKSR